MAASCISAAKGIGDDRSYYCVWLSPTIDVVMAMRQRMAGIMNWHTKKRMAEWPRIALSYPQGPDDAGQQRQYSNNSKREEFRPSGLNQICRPGAPSIPWQWLLGSMLGERRLGGAAAVLYLTQQNLGSITTARPRLQAKFDVSPRPQLQLKTARFSPPKQALEP
ncbi:hypothetical protein BX600DRAFT_433681 [Xylariales sp. PMI_506]|nr:hypothetical protein BX600DRAFT_433681 [Xylariales sp. PMI_506]